MKLMVVLLLLAGAPAGGSGCGVKPVKPVAPVGCRDLVAQCECDERGERCRWMWVCVR